jgi:hypothetical protein
LCVGVGGDRTRKPVFVECWDGNGACDDGGLVSRRRLGVSDPSPKRCQISCLQLRVSDRAGPAQLGDDVIRHVCVTCRGCRDLDGANPFSNDVTPVIAVTITGDYSRILFTALFTRNRVRAIENHLLRPRGKGKNLRIANIFVG